MAPFLVGAGAAALVALYTGAAGSLVSAVGVGPARPLPLGSYRVTSRVAPRWRDPVTQLPVPDHTPGAIVSTHSGVDLAAPTGTPVYACEAGVISKVYRDHYINGNALFVRTNAGEVWCYLHLSAFAPGMDIVGRSVARGARLGAVGSTGRSTGPHLHLQLYDASGVVVDPEPRFPGGL